MASYEVEVTSEARKDIRSAPGHLRARVLDVLHTLERNYSPPGSRSLDLSSLEEPLPQGLSLWRIRLDKWRLIYAVDTEDRTISVLAIRQRPPYQYEDLANLLQQKRR